MLVGLCFARDFLQRARIAVSNQSALFLESIPAASFTILEGRKVAIYCPLEPRWQYDAEKDADDTSVSAIG